MKKLSEIPIRIESGTKYTTPQGGVAIKDGIKAHDLCASTTHCGPKPPWLKVTAQTSPEYIRLKKAVHERKLATVCEEAKCPNISECWSHGNATVMLMGAICTRACRFCAVDTGNPHGYLDLDEPQKTAETVAIMKLQYVVLTSVNRDDLPDGGALHYANTIRVIKNQCPDVKVEALTPDFQGDEASIRTLLDSPLDVFAQNVETVKRLTHPVRDNRAGYEQTLRVLSYAKQYKSHIYTKTSLMLGLGETKEEILTTMDDLRKHQVDILTLGQYLQPTPHHYPMERYVTPEEFAEYRRIGLEKGFFEVASGPLVRSSYRADRVFQKNNLDL